MHARNGQPETNMPPQLLRSWGHKNNHFTSVEEWDQRARVDKANFWPQNSKNLQLYIVTEFYSQYKQVHVTPFYRNLKNVYLFMHGRCHGNASK